MRASRGGREKERLSAAGPSSQGQDRRQDRPAEAGDQNVVEAYPLLAFDHG